MENELWRVDYAHGSGHTVVAISGQAPRAFPIFSTPQEVRDWLAKHGYGQLGDDPDIWAENQP